MDAGTAKIRIEPTLVEGAAAAIAEEIAQQVRDRLPQLTASAPVALPSENVVTLSAELAGGARVNIEITEPDTGDRRADETVAVYSGHAAVKALAAAANVQLPRGD